MLCEYNRFIQSINIYIKNLLIVMISHLALLSQTYEIA